MPSCARLLSYWTRYYLSPWQDPFDTTKMKHGLAVYCHPATFGDTVPLRNGHHSLDTCLLKALTESDVAVSTQRTSVAFNRIGWLLSPWAIYTWQSPICCAKCRLWCNTLLHRNHLSFWPDLLHRHNCSFHHHTRFNMMCWVTRTEWYASRHRIHCCRIISSMHSTHLLFVPLSLEVQ